MRDAISPTDMLGASLSMGGTVAETVEAHGVYHAELIGADGAVWWTDTIDNLVTAAGKNDLLDKYLAGATYTAAPRMGLKGAGTAVVADTMGSHAGWSELGGANAPAYSGNRPVPAFAAASAGAKATSAAVSFVFTSGGTVAGAFLVMAGLATKDDTTGVLYSAGDFAGGSRTVQTGDTLNITYTASA